MYSYEDRVRAIQLYIKLDKRIRATIRQLGYRTNNALKSWHREYERRSALPKGCAGRPKYSQDQRLAAIAHYLAHDRYGCNDEARPGYIDRLSYQRGRATWTSVSVQPLRVCDAFCCGRLFLRCPLLHGILIQATRRAGRASPLANGRR